MNKFLLSSTIKEGIDAINTISELLIKKEQGSIEAYLSEKSIELDKAVLDLEKTGLGTYVSGEVQLILDEGDNFHLEGVFYFKKNDGNWVQKTIKGRSTPLALVFIPDDQERLRSFKIMKFEHQKP